MKCRNPTNSAFDWIDRATVPPDRGAERKTCYAPTPATLIFNIRRKTTREMRISLPFYGKLFRNRVSRGSGFSGAGSDVLLDATVQNRIPNTFRGQWP
jgi:hypothetical protein